MKKLLTFLLIGLNFVVNTSNAQTSPVAINDTFYVAFSDTLRPWNFTRTAIVANDTTKGGGFLKVDTTLYYNGLGSVSLIKNSLGLSSFTFTPPLGFFGLDSITYYLTNYPTNYGYDTAIIYIYVKRKDYENIDLNNVNAIIHKDVLFQNKESGTSGFEVPKGSGSNSIYAANFWFQGLDPGIQLKGYSETFVVNNQIGHAGPVMYDSLYENYSYQWDRVWKVNAIDIQNHISGSSTIEAITNWPAHGDTSKGQAQNLAPFVDVDFDGIYNPILGDYPKIKGQQAIYFIRNSDRSEQTLSNGSGSNLEFHGMVYVYDCSEDSAINNTVFIDYTIYNRSAFTLTNCYFGQWVDIDVGNSNDDYTACDVRRGTFYGYNGDGNDEPTNGDNGYGINLPAQGVTFLKGAKQDDDGNDNPLTTNIPTAMTQNGIPYTGLGIGFGDGTIDNEYFGLTNFTYYNIGTQINGNGSPVNGSDAYNYMKGKWANDNDIVWGGDGNPLGTGNPTLPSSYMFPGDSDPLHWGTNGIVPTPTIWSEASVGNNPNDRRGVGSTGPFTLLGGGSTEMELAFVFGRDYTTPSNNLGGIPVMQERVDSIRSYYTNGFATTPCGGAILGVKQEIDKNSEWSIYPNPFANQFLVNYQPSLNTKVEVFNLLGGKVLTQQITAHLTLLDLSNQPNGVYFVRVTDGKEVFMKKVIKQ